VAAIKLVESSAQAAGGLSPWLALPPCAIGIAGLLHDSWPGVLHLPAVGLHALFGALLWLTVLAQFRDANRAASPPEAAGVDELCRRLSRRVYLLLYVVFGVNALVRMAAILWNNGPRGALHPAVLPPPENLRDYLAYGVFALLTIHILAAARRQTLKRIVSP
jgi:cytochrome b561